MNEILSAFPESIHWKEREREREKEGKSKFFFCRSNELPSMLLVVLVVMV